MKLFVCSPRYTPPCFVSIKVERKFQSAPHADWFAVPDRRVEPDLSGDFDDLFVVIFSQRRPPFFVSWAVFIFEMC